jgi:hypothetical protein
MRAYASRTKVSPEKSRAEIETILGKYGATQRAIACDDERGLAQIAFVVRTQKYRLDVPMPKQDGTERQAQAARERWRAVVLLLKGKLELVRIGISTVEKEFMADLVLENGETMHVALATAIKHGLETGQRPMLALPAAGTTDAAGQ